MITRKGVVEKLLLFVCCYPVVKFRVVIFLTAQIEDHEMIFVIEPKKRCHICKMRQRKHNILMGMEGFVAKERKCVL